MQPQYETYFFHSVTKPIMNVFDQLTSLASFIARIWIGYVFLKAGILKLMYWQGTLTLFAYEFDVPLLPPHLAAILGTGGEIIFPILVILGFGSRLMILGLFLVNAIAVASYPTLWTADGLMGLLQHINWGIILLLLTCYGSGKWSIDHFLLKYKNK